MQTEPDGFLSRLKTALLGSPEWPLVLLGNFEVEDRWAEGERGLPQVPVRRSTALVNRMEEFALLLAGEGDTVVLKEQPDHDFVSYLENVGIPLPAVLCPQAQQPERIITEDVLADAQLLLQLGRLGTRGAALLPHGVSDREEVLVARSGLPLAGASATVCKAVNSKIFSRLIADELGLPQPPGWTCNTVDEWGTAIAGARRIVAGGGRVVVKDAFGVSGRGLLQIDSERRLDLIDRKIRSRAERTGDGRLALVVEEWVDTRADLNYQVTVSCNGSVRIDFVKEAITDRGVHKGHRMPARLGRDQERGVWRAAELIGGRLAAEGYVGIVGIDAMIDAGDRVLPVVEINARSNMSTYQVRIQQLLVGAGQEAWARQYPLRLGRRVPFKEIHTALDGLLLTGRGDSGVLVTNTATVNAAAGGAAGGFEGRLYALLVADTADRLAAVDRETARRLASLEAATIEEKNGGTR